jgi:hypothetical protein
VLNSVNVNIKFSINDVIIIDKTIAINKNIFKTFFWRDFTLSTIIDNKNPIKKKGNKNKKYTTPKIKFVLARVVINTTSIIIVNKI